MAKPTDITIKKHKLFGLCYFRTEQTTFKEGESTNRAKYVGHKRDFYLFGFKIKSIQANKIDL